MKRIGIAFIVVAAALLAVGFVARVVAQTSGAGSLSGTIYFQGKAPALRPIVMAKDPVCVAEESGPVLPEDGRVNSNATLPNAFVYISQGAGNLSSVPPANPVTLTQKGCIFVPHVLGIMVGQPLQVLTEDPTTHNIHVIGSKGNRDWNVTQQPGTPPVTTRFSRPEIMIPVHCNIHPWMEAWIGVVTNPYYAVTGDDGGFLIKDVPSGNYTLSVWTATFGTQEHAVTVSAGQSAKVDFTFTGP